MPMRNFDIYKENIIYNIKKREQLEELKKLIEETCESYKDKVVLRYDWFKKIAIDKNIAKDIIDNLINKCDETIAFYNKLSFKDEIAKELKIAKEDK